MWPLSVAEVVANPAQVTWSRGSRLPESAGSANAGTNTMYARIHTDINDAVITRIKAHPQA